jgi:diguanylate cyclase (GGDEF)-like protein
MISLKKYLDASHLEPFEAEEPEAVGLLPNMLAAYRSALRAIAGSTVEACPVVGADLKRGLGKVEDRLSIPVTAEKIEAAEQDVRTQLEDWGRQMSLHYRQKTDEVKQILLVMAHTAESVGERDQRAAGHLRDVTGRLQTIATLEDISAIRVSLEASARELKTSIDRMAAEGKAAVLQLQTELNVYQAKLEEAEQIASRDSLTGLRSRLWMENYLERRLESARPLSIVIVDIDEFKRVNDVHGHPVGDELLQQFATELKSACRSGDVVSRWGGDEFIIALDCDLDEARTQTVRLKKWACGNYTLHGRSGPVKLPIDASIGVASRQPRETVKQLLSRADTDMYEQKAVARAKR